MILEETWEYLVWLNHFDGFIADIAVTFLSVFLGVWLSIRYALKRFITEKWWERQAAAYEEVILAVYQGFIFFDEHLHACLQGRELDEGDDVSIRTKAKQADAAIATAKTIGLLKLSNRFLDRLRQLDKDTSRAGDRPGEVPSWVAYLEESHAAYSDCLADLQIIARKDLGL